MSTLSTQHKDDPLPRSPSGGNTPQHQGGLQTSAGDDGRLFAVLAYILPVIGGVVGMIADGDNSLTRFHARQSIAAVLTLILAFFVWAVGGYLISLIPIAGPILAIALFSLVIAMAIFLAANWVVSLAVVALRGEERTIPIANRLVMRLFGSEPALKNRQ